MPIRHRIDKPKGITFVQWTGIVTSDEFLAFVRMLLSDPDWPPSRRAQLVDLRTVRADASLDNAVIEQAVKLYAADLERLRGLKFGVVASDEFAKAVHFQELISRYGVSGIVFNSLSTACVWLGIDLVEAEGIFEELEDSSEIG